MSDIFTRVSQQVSDNVQRLKNTVGSSDGDDELPEVLQDDGERDRDFESDAAIVSEAIIDQFDPESVFDVGCGIGLHLKPFCDAGITANGIDEAKAAHENAVIPTRHIDIMDMTEPYTPNRQYDVVLCLDMLEYASRSQEDVFIATVAGVGDIGIVSVPLPRYSTIRYSREEPKEYWVQQFDEYGMNYDAEATAELQERIDADEEAWVPEQLLVFRREETTRDT
jgi:SAM-dependent methyltransferase